MVDTASHDGPHLSHDRPCPRCRHALHTYLACSDTCDCTPSLPPPVPAPRRAPVLV